MTPEEKRVYDAAVAYANHEGYDHVGKAGKELLEAVKAAQPKKPRRGRMTIRVEHRTSGNCTAAYSNEEVPAIERTEDVDRVLETGIVMTRDELSTGGTAPEGFNLTCRQIDELITACREKAAKLFGGEDR